MPGKDIPAVMLAPGWSSSNRFRLLDCDAALVEDLSAPAEATDDSAEAPAKQHRSEVHFKSDGAAAFVTTSRGTHAIRRVEFSNSLLVVRGDRIVEKCKYVFECNPARARTERAEALLKENYLTLDEIERRCGPPAPAKLLSIAALRDRVPACDAALDRFLEERGAVLHGPFVRLVHPPLLAATLDAVMRVAEAHVAALDDGVPLALLQESFGEGVEPVLLRACLDAHGSVGPKPKPKPSADAGEPAGSNDDAEVPTSAEVGSDGPWWIPCQRRVVARLADILLKEQEEDWRADAFFAALGQRYSLLAGLSAGDVHGTAALIDGKFLRRLPHEELPYDPLERYKRLVAVKPRWTLAELEGYLGPLEVSGKALAAFVGKHCREHKDHAGKGLPTAYSLA